MGGMLCREENHADQVKSKLGGDCHRSFISRIERSYSVATDARWASSYRGGGPDGSGAAGRDAVVADGSCERDLSPVLVSPVFLLAGKETGREGPVETVGIGVSMRLFCREPWVASSYAGSCSRCTSAMLIAESAPPPRLGPDSDPSPLI